MLLDIIESYSNIISFVCDFGSCLQVEIYTQWILIRRPPQGPYLIPLCIRAKCAYPDGTEAVRRSFCRAYCRWKASLPISCAHVRWPMSIASDSREVRGPSGPKAHYNRWGGGGVISFWFAGMLDVTWRCSTSGSTPRVRYCWRCGSSWRWSVSFTLFFCL